LLRISSSVQPIWCCEKKQLSLRSRLLAGSVFGFFGIATFFIDWQLRLLAADDSYIHLRIARNLIASGHAYFNADERVMVTSSPLWTIILAISALVFRHIPPAIPLEALCLGGDAHFLSSWHVSSRLAKLSAIGSGSPTWPWCLYCYLPFSSRAPYIRWRLH
jgi:hypothetical protein